MWALGVGFSSFFQLLLTSERHGGDHGVGLADDKDRRFDDGGGAPESCSSGFLLSLLYVMDDDGEIPRNKFSSTLETIVYTLLELSLCTLRWRLGF